ncbi:hypothetical protein R3P38DRAFT_2542174 [Favolaschia claudopus]|uniref:TPR-like protein n=1 Tax=Favolaschia claudopus TaxID=2862362 RepID=A0AAW0ATC9_9AGAR
MASVAALKAEGNSFFGAKNFADAEKKYTGAIEASDSADSKGLAVLYANRSACRLSLKRYLDANADATKATDLDPTYAKAHARLATSEDQLGAPHKSKESWQKALDALPKTNLTPAEETQKTQYTAGLRAAISALAQFENTKHYIPKADPRQPGGTPFIWQGNGRMPWDLAAPIVARLRNEPKTPDNLRSSAWVIHHAYEDWMNGLNMIRQVKVLDERTGAMTGIIGAITHITNGIMRDPRVMHIPDNEFIGQYNKQKAFQTKAWTEAGPEIIIKEALERQRTQGWDATRPALSITIRAWIMRSMMALGLYQQHQVAVEFYRNSLTVIRTLRDHWILESKADRGVIFEKSFIFGIQGLYLDALMQSYHSSNGAESLEVLSNLFKEAEVLIREINETSGQPREHDPVDPGFLSSFFLYPKGEAYA